MYRTTKEWIAHMHGMHQEYVWSCQICHKEFGDGGEFKTHLTEAENHGITAQLQPDDLALLEKLNASPKRFRNCLVCGIEADDVAGDLRLHMAAHLRRFALESIPWQVLADGQSEDISGSALVGEGSRGLNSSIERMEVFLDEVSLDFGEEEVDDSCPTASDPFKVASLRKVDKSERDVRIHDWRSLSSAGPFAEDPNQMTLQQQEEMQHINQRDHQKPREHTRTDLASVKVAILDSGIGSHPTEDSIGYPNYKNIVASDNARTYGHHPTKDSIKFENIVASDNARVHLGDSYAESTYPTKDAIDTAGRYDNTIAVSDNARAHYGNIYINNRYNYTLRQRRSDETLRGTELSRGFIGAVKEGLLPRVKNFLRMGVDLDEVDDLTFTALHHAVEAGHEDCVMLLLKYGADVNAVTSLKETPLALAIKKGQDNIVQMLRQSGGHE
jgi:hypothetical protein